MKTIELGSVFFCAGLALVPISSVSSAASVFVDDKPGFQSAVAGDTFLIDFETGSLPTFQDPLSTQQVIINSTGAGTLGIGGAFFGTNPLSGSNQATVAVQSNSLHVIEFNLANPTTVFGLHIGDMFDALPTITYALNIDNEASFMEASGGGSGGSVTTTTPAGITFPTGSTFYTFFGIVNDTPFQKVTLSMTTAGNEDNFVFDDVIVGSSAVIPLPATAWLFGSALAGLLGYRKTKTP